MVQWTRVLLSAMSIRPILTGNFFYDTPPMLFLFDLFPYDWSKSEASMRHFDIYLIQKTSCRIRMKRTKTNSTGSLLVLISYFSLHVIRFGEFVQLDVACFLETEASHANLSRVADCFTDEIHHFRERGPREQPQARGPTAPSTY